MLGPYELVSALAIEGERGFLNVRGAQEHCRESEFACLRFRALQHALSNAAAPKGPIEIHTAQLCAVLVPAFNAEHADDVSVVLDDPEDVAPGW